MTVHSAKGLEFPVVFVSGLDDGLFPLYVALENKKELEEEVEKVAPIEDIELRFRVYGGGVTSSVVLSL